MDGEVPNALQKARCAFLPVLPLVLRDLAEVRLEPTSSQQPPLDGKIQALFPLTSGQPLLIGKKGNKRSLKPLRVGAVFSGGQAAGGHNVITGIYDSLKQLSPHSRVFGFLGGPDGIIQGNSKELSAEMIASYRNQGGFDMIGSGRTKIETEEQLKATLAVVQEMQLDGLVIIGGDDSNTNAAVLAEYFKKNNCSTKVIGVPKTIDGDLKNAHVAISFGFDTACKTYAEIIGNIARDACSAKKYTHFIRLMGRSASHITLECALATQPNLALISEEVAAEKKTLAQIVSQLSDLVCDRAQAGKNYGVILIPEGLIEFIPEIAVLIKELNAILAQDPAINTSTLTTKLTSASQSCFSSLPEKIQKQLLLKRDPHGNVQVSLIETERLLAEMVQEEMANRVKQGRSKAKFFPVFHFLGYEGRAGYPSNFDCNYCYALGFTASLLIDEGVTGYMAFISHLKQRPENWGIGGIPLTTLLHTEMRAGKEKPVIQKALVDLHAKPFKHLQAVREQWKLKDVYLYPGPIQFFGPLEMSERPPLTLLLET